MTRSINLSAQPTMIRILPCRTKVLLWSGCIRLHPSFYRGPRTRSSTAVSEHLLDPSAESVVLARDARGVPGDGRFTRRL
jgi:hypothetical protein